MLRSDDEANALKLFMQAEHDKASARRQSSLKAGFSEFQSQTIKSRRPAYEKRAEDFSLPASFFLAHLL